LIKEIQNVFERESIEEYVDKMFGTVWGIILMNLLYWNLKLLTRPRVFKATSDGNT
jgi:hypothetical protein